MRGAKAMGAILTRRHSQNGPSRLGLPRGRAGANAIAAIALLISFGAPALALALTLAIGTVLPSAPALAQTAAAPEFPKPTYDPSLRDLKYYRYKRVAESGPERGRELYYFKCWQCHNEFQKTAPQLKGLYEGGRQIAGETVTDAVLANKIRSGGPAMPAFRHELNDADVAD